MMNHGKCERRKGCTFQFILLLVVLVAALVCSLMFGAQRLLIQDLLGKSDASIAQTIFFKIRVPRTILVAISGMLLAGAGAAFQMFFRNPLAEPGIMGISAGATLGAVIAACFGRNATLAGVLSPVNMGAFAGAMLAGSVVCALSGNKNDPAATTALLLSGTALGTLYAALTSITLAIHNERIHTMYIWMLGSFSGRGWNEIRFIALPALGAMALLLLCGRHLDLLSGGELTAQSLGITVTRLRLQTIVAGALATSAAVCAGGTIGFVGLIAPHLVRRLFGSRSRTLIPFSMCAGAALLLYSDTICRVIIPPAEIPVGTVTAILGAPFFLSLLFSKKGTNHA